MAEEQAWAGETNRSVDRALALLTQVALSPDPLRFADLAASTGLAKASLHQLLGSLLADQWLARDPGLGTFSIGPRAFEVGTHYPVQRDLRQLAAPILAALHREFNETLHFGVLDGTDVLYLDRSVSTHPVSFAAPLGHRLPAFATGLGKAMLYNLSPREVAAMYPDGLTPLTAHTVTSLEELLADLRRSRLRGYSYEEQQSTLGVRCVGVPVPGDRQLLAVSMAVPIIRGSRKDLVACVPRLQEAAAEIGAALKVSRWFDGATAHAHG